MVATTVLLERQDELALLERARGDARAGRGRFVLVEAAGGVGKSSLLDEVRGRAVAEGFSVLRARASEMEQDFAYGCVRQMMEPVLARAEPAHREALLTGAAALTGPLFAAPGDADTVGPGGAPDASFAMLHGLYWLVNNLAADGPVLLVLDDAHWADAASLRLMAYLAPRLDGLAVLALVSARPGEGDAAGVALLAAAPEVERVALSPLSEAGTRTLAEAMLQAPVAPEFAAACHAATAGTQFFLKALLREVEALGLAPDPDAARRVGEVVPASVAQAVLLRLTDAPAPARRLVRALAVLGDGASLAETAALAGLAQDEALAAVDVLIDRAIVELSDRLRFVHPIVGEAVYADLGALERAGAHARAADL
ncbi:MAG TPA: AAA family ATPase, partial [Baekduia sp.]|nr:AAA family ATPase [Baekduia sp.]